ncbi:hypothetical protein BBJ28_00019650, partial [Nothophytophthora sp. Chile5]
MANARLKLARQAAKRRRESDAQSVVNPSTEVPREGTASNSASPASNEPSSAGLDDRDAVKSALLDRKTQLEAQLEALTLGKPLPRDVERGCDASGRRVTRTHRDFLLQEMEWMAADFAQERKWRVKSARTVAQALVSHLDRQEARLARQKKGEEVAKRRTAARVGRDVKKFWGKIDKIIAYKVKLQADELRQRAMQRHLAQLVEQTERYSSALAASFQEGRGLLSEEAQEGQDAGGLTTNSPPIEPDSEAEELLEDGGRREEEEEDSADSEFEVETEEVDDERTIAAEERQTTQVEVDEELALLQEEGELSVDELRARYAAMEGENTADSDAEPEEVEASDSEDDAEFELTDEEVDDETTIAAEERRHGPVSRRQAAEEVATLQEESELSIDELRARYARALEGGDEENASSESEDADEGEGEDTDGDFMLTTQEEEAEADDETTIEAEEKRDGGMSRSQVQEELRLLQEEGDMSIEDLRARYTSKTTSKGSSNHDGQHSETSEGDQERQHDVEDEVDRRDGAEASPQSASVASGELTTAPIKRSGGFKRPYLLTSRLDLREYQETGVNWLISMCERRINGILADEMGLGKTIQTISLLAHLACNQGLWGPHLIVVPTSCLVNWEMEFKRWCPAFKVLTYFGSAKRRKELRQGWSKQNAFQVCITSYQLVVQDAHCFKRKKWYYLILDEAHNIKNWKSLRWQTLLTFSSQRRLLLTGTPLQNNLLELWALMHFLMPHVFASRKEFSYWFQNPLALIVENGGDPSQQQDGAATADGSRQLVTQLHGIIRPFVLRRLKKDVAKQLPGKFEHVITCQLSKRQRFLYEDFISRGSTRRAMFGRGKGRGANFMSMMNVLMQLRKVCNHPDLFEPRPIESPFDMPSLSVDVPSRCGYLVDELVDARPRVALWGEVNLPGLEVSHRAKYTSKRRRQLFFYDVSAPLPSDATAAVSAQFADKKDVVRRIVQLAARRRAYWEQKRVGVGQLQKLQVGLFLDEPVYGDELLRVCTMPVFISHAMEVHAHRAHPRKDDRQPTEALQTMVRDPEERVAALLPLASKAVCYVPKARARPAHVDYGGGGFAESHRDFVLSRKAKAEGLENEHARLIGGRLLAPYYDAFKRTQLFFPDKALVQFDCGKLQQLAVLLRTLKRGGHRCLIFTQMSSMLNILEVFLNLHGHTYFRLDGATKVEKRQALMERFNRDDKVFCFILSTRSGGLGINLTGADAVIFYDSDWNPAMDAQAQDRAHRIGQTRDVHIYRLVSEHTVEENILRKAQQKRHLDFLVMSEGQFTTDFFSKASLRELMTGSTGAGDVEELESEEESEEDEAEDESAELSFDAVENAMAQLEDEEDVVAMQGARAEVIQEQNEFEEETGGGSAGVNSGKTRVDELSGAGGATSKPSTPSSVSTSAPASEKDEQEGEEDEDIETVDGDAADEEDGDEGSTPDVSDDSEQGSVEDDEPSLTSITPKSSRKRQRRSSTDSRRAGKRAKISRKNERVEKRGDKVREKAREAAEEQKLQAWKASVSSLQGFEDSLNPVDRYALHFREDVDPLYAYTPAQQAAALAGVDPNEAPPTLLLDIERIEAEKRLEETRLIEDGELLAGRMDVDADPDEVTQRYTKLYRRERAHVHFERRKRLLTGGAWEIMKCVNTGQPFYFNADTREASWDRPAVWVRNEQLVDAQTRGYEGLPQSALLRVLALLAPLPERYHAQIVCKSWHRAAQHHSLFVKVTASDVNEGGSSRLAELLARVAPGDTVFFGPGVYPVEKVLEISTPMRLLAAPDAHVELQMNSGRAQLRWSARGGVICGFHLTRTSSAVSNPVVVSAATVEVKEEEAAATTAIVEKRESKRAARKREAALANWQHLLHVVGDGRVRMEYCELDGNGLGNACVCVWGRSKSKLKNKSKSHDDKDINSVPTDLEGSVSAETT